MMKQSLWVSALIPASLMAGSATASLEVHEPFDYPSTEPVNNGAYFGDGSQAGGLGLGTWTQRDNPNNVPPVNEADVSSGGITFTDSFSNVLPVSGNAYVRRSRVGQVASSSPIDASATAALTADGTTLWMSFLFQDLGFSGPDFGIGLATEKMVGDDNQGLETAGSGVGFGITSSGGQDRSIHTAIYDNSVNFTKVNEATPTFNGPGSSPVHFLAMKVNWNASGTLDEIFVFDINDISTEPAESAALAMDTFDFDLATQQALDVFNISDTQVGYVDEIRVGTAFEDVAGVLPPLPELSLEVDTVTGAIAILGDNEGAVSFNSYQIDSAGDSLDPSGWNSLADQDLDGNGPPSGTGDGWEEAGGSGSHSLAEAYLLGDSTIASGSQVGLGDAYDTSVDAQDIVFRYRLDTGQVVDGLVAYVAGFDPADLDQDGDVDDADFGIAFAAFTGPNNGPSSNPNADLDGDGDVDDADFGIAFAAFTGPGGSANVPEPASLALLASACLFFSRRRRVA